MVFPVIRVGTASISTQELLHIGQKRVGILLTTKESLEDSRRTVSELFNSLAAGECLAEIHIGPQGTIIHPSVYYIFDVYCHVHLDSKELEYRSQIEQWKHKALPTESPQEFWDAPAIKMADEPKAIRILVCGNTGVGKSTLINNVFGVQVVRNTRCSQVR